MGCRAVGRRCRDDSREKADQKPYRRRFVPNIHSPFGIPRSDVNQSMLIFDAEENKKIAVDLNGFRCYFRQPRASSRCWRLRDVGRSDCVRFR